jgi:hypothetical protein
VQKLLRIAHHNDCMWETPKWFDHQVYLNSFQALMGFCVEETQDVFVE